MCNQAGELAECSQSNFFLVNDGAVLTPPLTAGLLPGITRAFVLELARDLGYAADEQRLTPDDLARAGEAFITGTTREVTPVVRIDGRPIADGVPGPVTSRLLEAFRARVYSIEA
jgi:branched-subunit amino acid aminotransferase/4-amino-4-deoxychorismate lyase